MSTIALNAQKINQMPGLISDVKKSVGEYKSELFTLKKKVQSVNMSVCNLEDVAASIQTSTRTQEEKIATLETFATNLEAFVDDVVRIDGDIADRINKNKKDFYNKYNYLKPDCEKSPWEKAGDWFMSAAEWCKENWESALQLVIAIVVVVGIVALCVVTFGAMAVLLVAAIGAVVGVIGQLIGDVISFSITGKWNGSWQSYTGSAIGGAVGGLLFMLTGNPILACGIDGGMSEFIGGHLGNITGGTKRSSLDIFRDSVISGALAAILSKGLGKVSEKLAKNLSKSFPALRRLAGPGSYAASFKMVLTKLANQQIRAVTIKTFRNGVISGLSGDFLMNIAKGALEGIRSRILDWTVPAVN